MNLISLGLQGFVVSVIMPWLIQLIKPLWAKGPKAAWFVWVVCCAVGSVYLVLTKQVPEVIWSDPLAATSALLGFGSAVTALARGWYELIEEQVKKMPSIFS